MKDSGLKVPSSAEVIEFYNNFEQAKKKNARHRRIFQGLDRLSLGPGRDVLDLGCGAGITSVYMARQGCKVTGVDFSEGLLDHARKRNSNRNTTYICDDITKIDLEKKFDIIVACDVIEHLDPSTLQDFFRVIAIHAKPTTLLYISIPVVQFMDFAEHQDFARQPIESKLPLGVLIQMLDAVGYMPMFVETFGVASPIEYNEVVCVTQVQATHVYEQCYITQTDPTSPEGEAPNGALEGE